MEKIGIMQPYFMPYLGYVQLVFNTDKWVFFNTPKFNKKSWMNRNRILHPDPNKGFQYINLPISKFETGTPIKYIKVDRKVRWAERLIGQLGHYKRMRAPYYTEVTDLIYTISLEPINDFTSLVENQFNVLAEYLDLKINMTRSSDLDIDRTKVNSPGDWALEIAKLNGSKHYINPISGTDIFDEKKFLSSGIKLSFLKSNFPVYKQSNRPFTPGLSIIDLLMFNSPNNLRKVIRYDFKLLSLTEAKIYNRTL